MGGLIGRLVAILAKIFQTTGQRTLRLLLGERAVDDSFRSEVLGAMVVCAAGLSVYFLLDPPHPEEPPPLWGSVLIGCFFGSIGGGLLGAAVHFLDRVFEKKFRDSNPS
jgi:hypothetical protein